jgi:hypothetical protein
MVSCDCRCWLASSIGRTGYFWTRRRNRKQMDQNSLSLSLLLFSFPSLTFQYSVIYQLCVPCHFSSDKSSFVPAHVVAVGLYISDAFLSEFLSWFCLDIHFILKHVYRCMPVSCIGVHKVIKPTWVTVEVCDSHSKSDVSVCEKNTL